MRRRLIASTIALVTVVAATGPAVASTAVAHRSNISAVRAATAPFHRLSVAEAQGYKDLGLCIDHMGEHWVDTDSVDWVESYGNYVLIHTPDRRYIYRETMAAMEKKLDPAAFVRIRRSTMVRIDRIKELRPVLNGEFDVVLKNDKVLTSTRRYRKNLQPIVG